MEVLFICFIRNFLKCCFAINCLNIVFELFLNSSGSVQGIGQRNLSIWDQCSFLNKKFILSNIHLKATSSEKATCTDINLQCVYINNPNGFWEKKSHFINFRQRTEVPLIAKSYKFDTLQIFGNSLGRNFYNSIKKTPICSILFKKCSLTFIHAYVKFKYFNSIEEKKYDNKDFN